MRTWMNLEDISNISFFIQELFKVFLRRLSEQLMAQRFRTDDGQ